MVFHVYSTDTNKNGPNRTIIEYIRFIQIDEILRNSCV